MTIPAPVPSAPPVAKEILPNGFTILWREIPGSPVVSLRLYVRAGSLTEQEYLGYGISHVFEHLLCGGTTKTRPERESRKILESLGGRSNAYTSNGHTAYYITTAVAGFGGALDLLSDWVASSALDPAEVARELQVVEEEIRKYDNEPGWILHHATVENLFRIHPQRIPVIGRLPLMKRITRDDLVRYYERMYVPENMVFAGAGGMPAEAAMASLRAAFGRLPTRAAPSIVLPAEPPQMSRRFLVKTLPVRRPLATIAFRTVPETHPDMYPLDLLSDVLSGGESSRLVRLLRDERGLVSGIRADSVTPTHDAGYFSVRFDCDDANLPAIETAVRGEIARIAREGPTLEELDRAKRQRRIQFVFGRQTADALASSMGVNDLDTGDPAFDDLYLERIQRIGADDIRRVAGIYFGESSTCVTLVRPPRSAGASSTAAERASEGQTLRMVLDNGVVVLAKRVPGEPLVSVQGYFLGGVLLEDEKTNGITTLACASMDRGAAGRSAADIAAAVDALGGSIGASPGTSTVRVSALLVREDFERGMGILGDLACAPDFPAEEIERMRQIQLQGIRRRQDEWSSELRYRFLRKIHPSHPYGLDLLGTEASVKALTRADLAAWHRKVFVGPNLVVSIFGDLSPEEARRAAERAFGRLPKTPFALPKRPEDPALSETRRIEEPTDKTVASIAIGFPGAPLSEIADRAALDMLDAVLSGVYLPAGRLHQALRGEGEGLVYLVHAYHRSGLDPDRFEVTAACSPDKAKEVLRIIQEHLDRARREPFPADEIERGRKMWEVHRAIERQTVSDRASEAALYERLGLGHGFPDRYDAAVQKVTAGEMKKAAEKYFSKGVWFTLMPKK